MLKIENVFELMFGDARVSDGRLVQFAQNNLEAIKANDPEGFFTGLIEPTSAALNALSASQTEKDTQKSITEGATLNVDQLLKEFKQKALQREGLIRDTFGKDSPRYQEFYPHGTPEYTKCSKTTVEVLMERMAAAYDRNASELPPARVAEFTGIYNAYKAARKAQLETKTAIGKKTESKNSHRTALEYQLQQNLLTIALKYTGKPEMCSVFFNTTLLKPYRSSRRKNGDNLPPAT